MKDTFFFSHDYNARADRKLVSVIMKHGMTGLGVYWCLIEMLYEECGYLPLEYERISFELRTDKNVIQSIVSDFGLFQIDTDKFWSNSILERLSLRAEKSEKARKSINTRWKRLKGNTNVIRPNSKRNTIKERKGKERKGENSKEIIMPFNSEIFIDIWNKWKMYKKEEFRFNFKSSISEQGSLNELSNLSKQDEKTAILIIEQSIKNGWKGFFELKNNKTNGSTKYEVTEDDFR